MFGRRRNVKPLYIAALCVVMFFLINRFLFSLTVFVNNTTSYLVYPVIATQRFLVKTTKTFFARKKRLKDIEQSFNELNKKYHDLLAETIQLRASFVYQEGITELAEFQRRYDADDTVTAHIILRQISPQANIVLIDKGSRHGVRKDMVSVYKNILLGRVIEVYPLYSKVLLVTDATCKVAAYCAKTGASGIHTGTNALETSLLKRVSHLSRVQEGDLIISSGEGVVFPQGFGLGCIKSVKPDGLYFDVEIEPLIELQNINYCMVMRKGEETAAQDT